MEPTHLFFARVNRVAKTDLDRALSMIHMRVTAFADTVTPGQRKQIAHELRQMARLIESLS